MENQIVMHLPVPERAILDSEQIQNLKLQRGVDEAEDIIFRAVEAISIRLCSADRDWGSGNHVGLRKTVHAVAGIAHQIGLVGLEHVAWDVVQCIDDGDPVALAATLARLLRMGDISLSAVWDYQDGAS